jgi:hypothetical protein
LRVWFGVRFLFSGRTGFLERRTGNFFETFNTIYSDYFLSGSFLRITFFVFWLKIFIQMKLNYYHEKDLLFSGTDQCFADSCFVWYYGSQRTQPYTVMDLGLPAKLKKERKIH